MRVPDHRHLESKVPDRPPSRPPSHFRLVPSPGPRALPSRSATAGRPREPLDCGTQRRPADARPTLGPGPGVRGGRQA